jgi:hypothetical protein
VSDPLGLIAIENGMVPAPLVDAGAEGNNPLDVAQRAAVIGEPIPIVFGRRVGDYGGVLISPAATECRFTNDAANSLTTSYHLVLGEGQMDSLQVRDVFQGPCRVGSFSQAYSIRAGTWTPGNYITDPSYEASAYCGTIGTYTGLSTLSYQITTGSGNDFWQKQVHCFVRGGMHVPRLLDGITGPSNMFADLWQWSLLNISKQPASAIDTSRLTAAANFLNVNNLTCDIWLQESSNLEDFAASKASSFLLGQTRVNGQRGLRPLLPVNNDHTIKTTAVNWSFLFNEDYIIPETFEITFTSLVDRLPFAVKVLWRQQLEDDFGIIRTSEVRYPGEAIDGPYEQHDLSAFCTRESHAVKVGAYIRARRRWVTHTASWTTRAESFNTTLVQGDIVRVRLDRIVSANSSKAHDYLYQVDRITETQAGDVKVEATHFPIDSQGRSLVALDVANTVGNGILFSSNRTGVSCDLNSSTDTTVPASTSTDGTDLDSDVEAGGPNGGQAVEGTPQESTGTGPDTTAENPTDNMDLSFWPENFPRPGEPGYPAEWPQSTTPNDPNGWVTPQQPIDQASYPPTGKPSGAYRHRFYGEAWTGVVYAVGPNGIYIDGITGGANGWLNTTRNQSEFGATDPVFFEVVYGKPANYPSSPGVYAWEWVLVNTSVSPATRSVISSGGALQYPQISVSGRGNVRWTREVI